MTTTTPSKRGPKPIIDEDTQAIIYQGASLIQLSQIFGMDTRDIKAKIFGHVTPCGNRRGHDVYSIREIAPYIVSPPYDIDEFIQRMTIADLPSILRKEFWAGLRSRQLYEKEAAELWPTADVVDMVSELFKTLRMSLLLTRETVERESELTDRQRDIITRIIDNALEDAHAKTVSKFTEAKQSTHSAEIQSESEADSEDL